MIPTNHLHYILFDVENELVFSSKANVTIVKHSGLAVQEDNNHQLLHQYHKILTACIIQGERACEFSFNIAQSQYFVVLME